jgi:hypothetical protein
VLPSIRARSARASASRRRRCAESDAAAASTSIRAEFEVTVERKFDRARNGNVCAPSTKLPQLAFVQIAQVQPDVRI